MFTRFELDKTVEKVRRNQPAYRSVHNAYTQVVQSLDPTTTHVSNDLEGRTFYKEPQMVPFGTVDRSLSDMDKNWLKVYRQIANLE